MRTIVYVDGFNLYYRMLKNEPSLKWLNPVALSSEILNSDHNIIQLNYYIARVSKREHDPEAPARQATYLKALGTVPEIRIHTGSFMLTKPMMPLALPPKAKPEGYIWSAPYPESVRVVKSEEKGSDVNLGAHLVRDALTDKFDVGIVITNDTDLVEAIRIATQEAGKKVGLLVPVSQPAKSLLDVASVHLHIRTAHLKRAQFASPLPLPSGAYLHKPLSWA